ncbi:hypothetical protein BN2497_12929 [Janthinobacterium sp. CG23_2]|nr:hypothetical protein BN2497_12929 [Janthinobacterium sp. CG23_2]CUU32862.1 hypothetical protein BN3177_12929 [Janthinobacterium sp. CG23_2]
MGLVQAATVVLLLQAADSFERIIFLLLLKASFIDTIAIL